MNLHEVAVAPETPEPPKEHQPPTCECGNTGFRRREHMRTRQNHYMAFRAGRAWPEEDWETIDEDFDDADEWECDTCGQEVGDDLHDRISEY